MEGIRFTLEQQELLRRNPQIAKVSEKSITYEDSFKLIAIDQYMKGKSPSEIFRQAGIRPELIGKVNPKRYLERWRNSYRKHGDTGLIGEKQGYLRNGVSQSNELSMEERLKAMEAKSVYLEMEKEFLKKLDELERRLSK